jgi:hypothetical protein
MEGVGWCRMSIPWTDESHNQFTSGSLGLVHHLLSVFDHRHRDYLRFDGCCPSSSLSLLDADPK